MLLLRLLNLLLDYDDLIDFIYELFAKINFLQVFCVFSKYLEEELDIPLIVKLKCFLNYS
jgi:hypothetical protein